MKFRVGDKVRVVRKVDSYDPNGMGEGEKWCHRWSEDMSNFIGKEVEVKVCYVKLGYCTESGYCFPETALELVVEDVQKKSHYDLIIAWANGADIQFKNSKGEWKDIPAPSWYPYHEYRIKPSCKEPSIPWDQISSEYKWYARNAYGKCNFYKDEPNAGGKVWISYYSPIPADFLSGHAPGNCPWEESLVERPEGE